MSDLLKLKELEERAYKLFPSEIREVVQDLLMAEMYTDLGIYGLIDDHSWKNAATTLERLEERITALENGNSTADQIARNLDAMTEKDQKDVLSPCIYLRFRKDGLKSIRKLQGKYPRPLSVLIGQILQGWYISIKMNFNKPKQV